MFTSLRVNKVEFTLSQWTILCYDMSLITLLSHLLGAFEGFQNYNLIKINTKHANYKNRVAEKNHFKCSMPSRVQHMCI